MQNNTSSLELYLRRVFKLFVLFLPLTAFAAGVVFTVLKLCGYYQDTVQWIPLIIFDCTNVLYVVLGFLFYSFAEDKNGDFRPHIINIGKIFIYVVILIQWNYISYMIPSNDYWAFYFLFTTVIIFFLDYWYYLFVSGSVLISIVISWCIKPALLPVQDANFVPNLILRIVLFTLLTITTFIFLIVIRKVLVGEIEKVADYDTLTLLKSRRTLNQTLEKAIKDADKTEKPFCVLMCDIDDFKIVNDTHGHSCGDIVLKNLANIFLYNTSNKGVVYRYGGEEIFCIFYLDQDKSFELAEFIREKVKEMKVNYQDNEISVTVTIGLTEYKNGMKPIDLIRVSDANLYYGKNHGKNRVIK